MGANQVTRLWTERRSPLSSRRRVALWLAPFVALGLAACSGDSSDVADDPSAAASPSSELPGQLMFSRFDESTHTFISTHIADADGANERELPLPGPEGGGRWSRSGREIAVMDTLPDDRIGTAIIAPDGTVRRVLKFSDDSLNLVCTAWSWDDRRLACEGWDNKDPSRSGIYVISAGGGSATRLTTTPKGVVDIPGDFSPDGTQFIFKRAGDEQPGPLLIANVQNGTAQPLSKRKFDDPGRFSPDGKSVLTSDGETVFVLDLEGAVDQTIEIDGLSLFGPVWSPDGEWIAFSGAGSGPFADIYISRPDGSEQRQVTETEANEIVVEWGAG